MQRPFLVGERLYLRAPELSDADDLIRWVTRPEVRPFLSRRHPLNRVQEEEWIRSLKPEKDMVLVIVLTQGDRSIGCIGLHGLGGLDPSAELGIAIGETDCWGQRYGSEAIGLVLDHAFDELGLHRVRLKVWANNGRGIACYEKLGFIREGVEREARWQNGQWIDNHNMAILDREWRARRAERLTWRSS